MNDLANQPEAAPEHPFGAALLSAMPETGPLGTAVEAQPVPDLPPLLPVRSPKDRVILTDTSLTVQGREFSLLELERAEVMPVKWILWYLLGGLGLAGVMIAFLQNRLHTGSAMLGMVVTALLLAYGHRGTNRLRLLLLGREAVHFALPGETLPWQRLVAETNRRINRVHDHAARQAAAMLAAADEAIRQAAQAEREAAHGAE